MSRFHILLSGIFTGALALVALCASAPSTPSWPLKGAQLKIVELRAPGDGGVRHKPRIYIDAGHGTGQGNVGNTSSICEKEEEFTARAAEKLYAGLAATGRFELKLSRKPGEASSYQARVKEAEAWHADAMIGLHSDCRGLLAWCAADGGRSCPCTGASHDAAGFSVLFSDEDPELAPARRELARALSRRMAEAGFLPYDGFDYVPNLYGSDEVAGAFVDRHAPGQRIFMLRRPRLATVIVETHHASDLEERERWEEPRTYESFTAAVAAAVLDAQASGPAQEALLAR